MLRTHIVAVAGRPWELVGEVGDAGSEFMFDVVLNLVLLALECFDLLLL